ncbi:GNAT family N-acetyltransferase [Pleomorphomonas oryzae]|uniref:GNAT family N-acetyltransferase n=1 Tax=Pleomorphomonas oryzae TaxID=261934 RepID=UPI00040A2CE9|nr:GNAT family N-acetyltransferase [Pleomorphomonas oryzae]
MMPANHSGSVRRVSLHTERLTLRPTNRADADRAFEIQSDWDVTRMLRMARFPPDLDETVGWFAEHEQEWLAGTAYRFAVLREGRMIGLVDIDEVDGGEGDLGYWFEKAGWGQGFAFEAARAVADFAFGALGLTRLRSGHAADNPASGNVLMKLGFRPLSATRRPSRSRGEDILHQSYVLMREESGTR